MEYSTIPVPPDPSVLAAIPAGTLADTIERLIAELDTREAPLIEDTPMFPGQPGFVDLGDDFPGDSADAEPEVDCCTAGDDAGTDSLRWSSFSLGGDGLPGDPTDAEDGGDTEPNGDEGDHSR